MKQKNIFLSFILAFLPLVANADAVKINGIYYNLNADNHTAEVTSCPNNFSGEYCSGEIVIPSTVNYSDVNYSVTSIGEGAFASCDLISVTIPNSVTSIGEAAFNFCENLKTVNIPPTVTVIGEAAFGFCESLEEITLPDGLTAIEGATFFYCSSLKKLTIPSTVTRIGSTRDNQVDAPFAGCPLKTLVIPSSVQTLGRYSLWVAGSIIFESPTPPANIDDYILKDILGFYFIKEIIVPNGSKDAYQSANAFKEHPDKIVEMSQSTVRVLNVSAPGKLSTLISDEEKYNIETMEISGQLNGTDIRLLRDMAGNNYLGQQTNGKLKYLDISRVDIVAGGERYLDTTAGVVVSNQSTLPGTFQFETQNNVIGESMFLSCQKLEEILLPNSITTIVAKSFGFCKELKSFVIPKNISSIDGGGSILNATDKLEKIYVAFGNQTFSSPENSNAIMQGTKLIRGCKNTIIPSETTIIGECSFMGSGINTITIPENVESIENDAFNSCGDLATIMVEVKTPIVINNTVFDNYSATLNVPENCKTAYKSADYWKEFTIEEFILPKARTDLAYTGSAQDLITTGSFQGMVYSVDTDINYSTNLPQGKDAKDYIVSYRDESHNISGSINVTIAPKVVTKPTIITNNYFVHSDYNQYPIESEVFVKDGETIIKAEEYTVSYSNNTNIGTATVTITDNSGGNYNVSGTAPYCIGLVLDDLFDASHYWTECVAPEDLELPTGLTAYVITNLSSTSATASQIDYIPQGVPVLLKRESVFCYYRALPGTGIEPTENLLKVYNTDRVVANREGYVLYNDEFVLVNEGTIPAGKVFLPADGSGSSLTRSIVIEGDGLTGIDNRIADLDISPKSWYDIQGRKLSQKPLRKGVYVFNGRKVVVK